MNGLRSREVLRIVLLRTLSKYQEGLSASAAYDVIYKSHRFPEEWNRELPRADGYEILKRRGITDWRTVPQAELVELVPTEPQWQNELRWARNEIRKAGQLDLAAPYGMWRLNKVGQEAAKKLTLNHLAPDERRIVTDTWPPQTPGAPRPVAADLRGLLSDKLRALTRAMPVDDLYLLVDIARAIRARSLPTGED